MGGGKWQDAFQQLAVYPPLWAALVGLSLGALGLPLPASVDAISASLAPANKPLMLLAAGMTMSFELPQPRMVGACSMHACACMSLHG